MRGPRKAPVVQAGAQPSDGLQAPIFSEREQVALAWTESVTKIAEGAPTDELFERARKQFTDEELVNLNLAVATINA